MSHFITIYNVPDFAALQIIHVLQLNAHRYQALETKRWGQNLTIYSASLESAALIKKTLSIDTPELHISQIVETLIVSPELRNRYRWINGQEQIFVRAFKKWMDAPRDLYVE